MDLESLLREEEEMLDWNEKEVELGFDACDLLKETLVDSKDGTEFARGRVRFRSA